MYNIKVSLIVPVKNEAKSIVTLLESIFSQTDTPDEVIIIDGGSTDETPKVIKKYIERGYNIKLIEVKKAYPGEGRNIGTSLAKNNLIAYTDAGIVLHHKWLENLLEVMKKDPTVDVVYGHYEPVRSSFFKDCESIAYISPPDQIGNIRMRHHFIASSLMKKRVWEELGGFPCYRASEDLIFTEQIDKRGFKIGYAPDAIVYWDILNNPIELFKKYTDYSMHNLTAGRWKYWHYTVFKIYFMVLLFLLLGIYHNLLWLSLIFLGLIGRSIKRYYINAKMKEILRSKGVSGLFWVTVILLVLDVATFVGICKWIIKKRQLDIVTRSRT